MDFYNTSHYKPIQGTIVTLMSFVFILLGYIGESRYVAIGCSFVLFICVTTLFFNSVIHELKRLNGDYDG